MIKYVQKLWSVIVVIFITVPSLGNFSFVSASMSGNVGVLHLIEKQSDLEWLLRKGPHDPYVPLLSSDMFNE